MLEMALFITKLFLDGWEKLFSEDVLVPFIFMAMALGKIVSEPTPLAEKQPHT
jgi:NADH:ubiquinone oxidoreductase subunit H